MAMTTLVLRLLKSFSALIYKNEYLCKIIETKKSQTYIMKKIYFKRSIVGVLAGLAVTIAAVSCDNSNKVSDKEIAEMQGRLDSIMGQYEQLKSANKEYDGQMSQKDSTIKAQAAEIRDLLAQLRRARGGQKPADHQSHAVSGQTTVGGNASVSVDCSKQEAELRSKESVIKELQRRLDAQEKEISQLKNSASATVSASANASAGESQCKAQVEKLQRQVAQQEGLIASLNGQIASLNTQIDGLNGELKASGTAKADASANVSALTKQNESLTKQNAELNAKNAQLSTKIAKLESDIAALNDQVKSLGNQQASLSGQASANVQLEGQVKQLNTQLAQLEKTKAQLEAQLAECNGKVSKLETSANASVSANASATQQLEAKLSQCTAKSSQLEASVSQLNARVKELESQLSTAQSNLEKKGVELAQANASVSASASANVSANAKYEQQIATLQAQVESQKADVSRLQKQLSGKEAALAKAQADVTAAQKQAETALKEAADAKANASVSVSANAQAPTASNVNEKLAELQKLCDSYAAEIERLRTENEQLKAENNTLRTENSELRKLDSQSDKIRQKLEKASILVTTDVTATPGKSISGTVVKETSKGSDVKLVKIDATILDNYVVDPGTITIYARISNSKNRLVSNEGANSDTFKSGDTDIQYTAKQDIEFWGGSRKVSIVWRKLDSVAMEPGLYWVTLYANGNEIGKVSFTLK